ncbi:MAG: YbgC/FadM family acyl-CoA thioesterase [Burkholderiales bacterium]|nr:YbgC/FadM family acyl-CoA thioesterase [Burkholderiales bacterium]
MTHIPATSTDFRLWHRLRVRWAEVDMQKIVFNGHYLMYFDNAMGDYWRALALPYEAAMQQLGGDLYVKKASVEYFGSACYDDLLNVGLRCRRIGNSSITMDGVIDRGDTRLITCELVYVYANPATQTPQPVPTVLRAIFDAYEAGESMVDLRTGSWAEWGALISPLRAAVFVEEQGIDASLEWDASDATAVHAVACNRLGQAVATGRLLHHAPGVARIGRMAVARPLRGSQLGRSVLQALEGTAQVRGDTEVVLHAQCSAEDFYTRNGYVVQGAVFEVAGIRHIAMQKRLLASETHRS